MSKNTFFYRTPPVSEFLWDNFQRAFKRLSRSIGLFTPSSQKEIFSLGVLNNRRYTENFETFIEKSLGNTEFFSHFAMKVLIPFID